jgi:hypothetical protein
MPEEKLLVADESSSSSAPIFGCYCRQKKKTAARKSGTQIRSIALVLFFFACVYWLYKVYTNATGGPANNSSHHHHQQTGASIRSRTRLKLINVFNRHGERSPNEPPPGDEFTRKTKFFWPNGRSNLTDSGRFRQFRVGLELRKRYEDFLDFNASHYLAFSSPIYRCQESMEYTLRGLFDIDWPLSRGLKFIEQYNAGVSSKLDCLASNKYELLGGSDASPATCDHALSLPSGSGSPLEYKQIKIDTESVPTLTYDFLTNCKYRLDHPTPVDTNLSASAAVSKLKGTGKLQRILENEYGSPWAFKSLSLWSTLAIEIGLARTRSTVHYGSRNYKWATQLVVEYDPVPITLFDLYEQVALLAYRDRVAGTADYIQLGPMISSMIASQRVALERAKLPANQPSYHQKARAKYGFKSHDLYVNKKAVFYSSHDTVLQLLLHRLGVIAADEADYETRFKNWRQSDDIEQLMAGLRMAKFGMSLVFELYEMKEDGEDGDGGERAHKDGNEQAAVGSFAFVEVSLYNQEDGKHRPVEYRKLNLGQICERLFLEQNPSSSWAELDRAFYDQKRFPIDRRLSCPFGLFENITSRYMIDSDKLDQLCPA